MRNNSRGFVMIPILIVFLILGVVVLLLIKPSNYNSDSYSDEKTIENTNTPQAIEYPDNKPSPTLLTNPDKLNDPGKMYLTFNLTSYDGDIVNDYFLTNPDDTTHEYMYEEEAPKYLYSTIIIDGSTYTLYPSPGGSGGPCSNEEFGNTCGYIDEPISPDNTDVTIDKLRIWEDETGIFFLNPITITNKSNPVSINHLSITKKSPNNVFAEDEVETWRQILKTIDTD